MLNPKSIVECGLQRSRKVSTTDCDETGSVRDGKVGWDCFCLSFFACATLSLLVFKGGRSALLTPLQSAGQVPSLRRIHALISVLVGEHLPICLAVYYHALDQRELERCIVCFRNLYVGGKSSSCVSWLIFGPFLRMC